MASSSTPSDDLAATSKTKKQPSVKVDGRFVNPWETWKNPSMMKIFSTILTDPNLSNVPSQEELDLTLPVVRPDQAVLANPPIDRIQATWIGHATVLVQMDGLNFLTDPIFAERCSPVSFMGIKRYRPAALPIADLPPIDVVVISHNHYDHLSLPDVAALGNKILYLVPLGTKEILASVGITNVVELDWWESHVVEKKVTRKKIHDDGKVVEEEINVAVNFTAVPCQHWCKRTAFDQNLALWCGWAVVGPNRKFYYSGDTGYCAAFKQIGEHCGPFDLAALPIGAYAPKSAFQAQHIDPEEAVLVHQEIRAKKSLGVHWGTFVMTHEFYLEPPRKLKEVLEEKGLPLDSFITTNLGEVFLV